MRTIFLFLFLLIFSPIHLLAEHKNDEYCKIDPSKSFWDAWKECEGKSVKITGKITHSALQHPTGLHDTLDPETFKIIKKYEQYLDIGDSQIVITSDKKIECSRKIEIEGIVDIIDLGGKDGTKLSYKNVWIKVQNYECK